MSDEKKPDAGVDAAEEAHPDEGRTVVEDPKKKPEGKPADEADKLVAESVNDAIRKFSEYKNLWLEKQASFGLEQMRAGLCLTRLRLWLLVYVVTLVAIVYMCKGTLDAAFTGIVSGAMGYLLGSSRGGDSSGSPKG